MIKPMFAVATAMLWAVSASADIVRIATPETYLMLLQDLSPGDKLALSAGIYERGLPVHHINGAPNNRVIITGPSGGAPAIFRAHSGRNIISIANSSYVTIRNLEISGGNLPVDGVKCEGHAQWAHHITLENLYLHGHGNNQQTVGISTKCPAWGWVIRGNRVVGAGTGIYLGNSDGSAPFVAGLIEHNVILDTLGYNLQIKQQTHRPELPGLPNKSSTTIIRHNVFSKEHGASSGPLARPNVLVGHFPLQGPGADDIYLIYGNFFYQNPTEALFQGEGNIALYNNLLVNHFGDAVRIRPHNDTPRDISVFYNSVVASGTGIALSRRDNDPAYNQLVAGNAVFAKFPLFIPSKMAAVNVEDSYNAASEYLTAPHAPLGSLDLYPRQGKLRINSLNVRLLRRFTDWDLDFNGTRRQNSFAGAYAGEGNNPGWLLRKDIKL